MGGLALDYFLFIFVASCGVFQLAAARGKLKGLLFFKGEAISYIFGILAILGAFSWFFTVDDRNALPVLEGGPQFRNFLLGSFSALLFTLILSSLIKILSQGLILGDEKERGLEALKEKSYLEALLCTLNQLWKRIR